MNYGKEEAKNPAETFGEYIFGDAAMKKYLTAKTYASLRKTIDEGEPIDPEICAEVAEAMKNWAMSFGATHYTHWFQPLTGTTAGKHEAFLDFCGKTAQSCVFRENRWWWASPTLLLSPPTARVRPVRRADIRRGIPRLPHS